jgi:hypothetical protein
MPTKEYYKYRYWCQNCNDFTLFDVDDDNKLTCSCGKEHIPTLIHDIPKEKLDIQRKRFKDQRKQQFYESYKYMSGLFANILMDVNFSLSESKILESDAGLQAEEKREKERRERIITERKNELSTFSKVGRNDICLCGSTKKYKKCCEIKHKSW